MSSGYVLLVPFSLPVEFLFTQRLRIYPRDWFKSKNSVIVYLFMSVMSAVRVLIPAHFISSWDSFDGCPPRQFLCSQLYSEFLGTRENKIITHHNNEETPHAHKSNSFVSRDTFHGLT